MFKFEVEFWDEELQEPNFEIGITDGKDYGEAANHVSDYYGFGNIVSMELEKLNNIIVGDEVERTFKPQEIYDNEWI